MTSTNEEYNRLQETPGTPQYKARTTYLRAAGFTTLAAARERHEGEILKIRASAQEQQHHAADFQDTIGGNLEALLSKIKESLPNSREKSLALTKLEEAGMWLSKAPR